MSEMPRSFEELFREAVDEGLQALGESVKQVTYYYLEHDHGLDQRRIPDDPEGFQQALQGLYSTGSKVIEDLIVKKLFGKVGADAEQEKEKTFVEKIEVARSILKRYE